jgi:hypothetical protein
MSMQTDIFQETPAISEEERDRQASRAAFNRSLDRLRDLGRTLSIDLKGNVNQDGMLLFVEHGILRFIEQYSNALVHRSGIVPKEYRDSCCKLSVDLMEISKRFVEIHKEYRSSRGSAAQDRLVNQSLERAKTPPFGKKNVCS